MQNKLHHIKKAKTGGYQIQFIVKGKSHSGFSMDLDEAIAIRDKMQAKLHRNKPVGYRNEAQPSKESLVPGTERPMHAGISMSIRERNHAEEFYILVNWIDYKGKQRTKAFYACRDTTFSVARLKATYSRAYQFRRAYEKARKAGKIKAFDHRKFNLNATH
jgi:hypothetical protein